VAARHDPDHRPALPCGDPHRSGWREVKAVQTGHIHLVPDLPFSWLDNPPAPNRLIGLLWLGKLLYPAAFPQDIRAEARRFYALFYQQEPSDAQLDRLFADPAA
jgi:iron complex transport system substrate-binding protein